MMNDAIAEHLRIFTYIAPIALIFLWTAMRSGFFSYPEKSLLLSQKIPFRYTFAGFCVFLATQLLIVPLITLAWLWLFYPDVFQGQDLSLTLKTQAWFNLFAVGTVAATMLGFYSLLPRLIRDAVWRAGSLKGISNNIKSFLWGIVTCIFCYPIVIAFAQILAILVLLFFEPPTMEQVAVKQLKGLKTYPMAFYLTATSIFLIVPMIEEFLFRGLFQTWLSSRYGRNKAVLFASLVFAMFHFSSEQGIRNIEILSSLFVLSLFLGFIYERQQSLWAPIGLHAAFNSINVTLIFLESQAPPLSN